MNISKTSFNISLFVGVLFIVFPLIHFRNILDTELTPRFFGWAILVAYFSLLLLYQLFQNKTSSVLFFDFSNPLIISLTVYLFLSVISLHQVVNFSEGVYEVLKIGLQISFLFILLFLLKTKEESFLAILKGIHISVILFAVFGWYQFYLVMTGSHLTLLGTQSGYGLSDISSTLSNKNLYAEVLLLLLPFVLCGLIFLKGIWKKIAWIDAGIIIFHIVILQSIAVWLTIIISFGGVCLVFWRYKKLFQLSNYFLFSRIKATYLFLAGIFVLILSIYSFNKYSKIELITDVKNKINFILHFDTYKKLSNENPYKISNSVFDRALLYRNTLLLAKEKPIFGVGISNWEILHPKFGISGMYYLNSGTQLYQQPHNDFLWILSELGITGLISFLLVFIFSFIYAVKIIKNPSSTVDIKLFALCMLGGIIAYAGISFFSFPKQRIFHLILWNVILTFIMFKYYEFYPIKKFIRKNFQQGILFFCVLTSLVSVFVGYKRFQGEKHFLKIISAQFRQDWKTMIYESDQSYSDFYTIDNTTTPILWYRGLANFYNNNLDAAFTDFLKAEKENPYHIHLLNNIASCYEMKGNHQKSIEYYLKALQINPGFYDALLNLSIVYFNSGKTDEAYSTINQFQNKADTKYQEILLAVLQAKSSSMIQSMGNSPARDSLSNKIKEKDWLIKINEQAITGHQTFENEIRKQINKYLVE